MGTPTRTSKRLALEGPPTPLAAGEAAARSPLGAPSACPLLSLPTDLLEACLSTPGLLFSDLVALECCTTLRPLAADCRLWRREWERVYGPAGPLQEAAVRRAGSWKALFGSRHTALKEADPWRKPSPHEVLASVDQLLVPPPGSTGGAPGAAGSPACAADEAGEALASDTAAAAAAAAEVGGAESEIQAEAEAELCLAFLVDGSVQPPANPPLFSKHLNAPPAGSVTEEDFRVMTAFMSAAVGAAAATPGLRAQACVLQFSNDVRVEQPPTDVDVDQFDALMAGLQRLNGGTNIALAVQRAGQLLKPLGPATRRVLVLLTDGRIDSHQSREARDMCARLADEQAGVGLHAYGVGRGVDREELLRIISACDPDTAEDRYLGLMVLDEAPW